MKPFLKGFVLGVLLKNKIFDVTKVLLINSINFYNNVFSKDKYIINDSKQFCNYIILKITNEQLFKQTFEILPPLWEYNKKRKTIKIDLPDNLLNIMNTTFKKNVTFNDIMNLKNENNEYIITIDIPLLITFSELRIYFEYTINEMKYINVYTPHDLINLSDFFESKKKTPEILCASLKYSNNNSKTEYLTTHINKFIKNKEITTESILLNYSPLKINLEQSKLYIVNKNKIKEYSYKDYIQLNN